jgi:hypothetical protein
MASTLLFTPVILLAVSRFRVLEQVELSNQIKKNSVKALPSTE